MYARAALAIANFRGFGRRLFGSQSGATAVEYGLIAGCIAVLLIVSMTTLGTNLNARFQYFADFFNE